MVKYMEIAVINILQVFKKIEESMSMLRRDMEDTKKIKMKLLRIKNIMSEVKNTLIGITRTLDTHEKRLMNLRT